MRKTKMLFALLILLLAVTAAADPPPFIPGNACEAQCLVDYRECNRICSEVLCLISCETLADLCLAQCAAQ